MGVLTLDAARAQLRVGDEIDDVDLQELVDAAEQAVADFLGRPLIDPTLGWADAATVPANVRHAIKVALTALYDDREAPIADMTSIRNLAGRYVVNSIG